MRIHRLFLSRVAYPMSTSSLLHSPLLKPSSLLYARSVKLSSSSSLALNPSKKSKYQQPIAAVLEVGGVKIAKNDVVRESDPTNNVPDSIFGKLGMQLHRRENHPLGILKDAIYGYFDANFEGKFFKFDDLCPIVTIKENFDDVLVPADHVSRSYNDTYYVDSQHVLRCHTSAHQAELLRKGNTHFLVTGDVYRRDSIDSTHYPVFHQMEGVRVFSPDDWVGSGIDATSYAATDLKKSLEGLAQHLFGEVDMRWVDTYFPFTNPSFELEIYFKDEWMEVLGCGVTEQEILKRSGRTDSVAWAFGLGLERLAMVLFDIPDIRLFWSTDQRFTSQVQGKKVGVSLSSDKDQLFFGNLRKDWSTEEFDKLVHQAFEDVSVDLAMPPSSEISPAGKKRLNRGFAFVQFSSHAVSHNLMISCNFTPLGSRHFYFYLCLLSSRKES